MIYLNPNEYSEKNLGQKPGFDLIGYVFPWQDKCTNWTGLKEALPRV